MSFSPNNFMFLSEVWRQWWRTLISSCLEFSAIKWSVSNGIKAENFRTTFLSVCVCVAIKMLTSNGSSPLPLVISCFGGRDTNLSWLKEINDYSILLVSLDSFTHFVCVFFLFFETSSSSSKRISEIVAIHFYLGAGSWSCLWQLLRHK